MAKRKELDLAGRDHRRRGRRAARQPARRQPAGARPRPAGRHLGHARSRSAAYDSERLDRRQGHHHAARRLARRRRAGDHPPGRHDRRQPAGREGPGAGARAGRRAPARCYLRPVLSVHGDLADRHRPRRVPGDHRPDRPPATDARPRRRPTPTTSPRRRRRVAAPRSAPSPSRRRRATTDHRRPVADDDDHRAATDTDASPGATRPRPTTTPVAPTPRPRRRPSQTVPTPTSGTLLCTVGPAGGTGEVFSNDRRGASSRTASGSSRSACTSGADGEDVWNALATQCYNGARRARRSRAAPAVSWRSSSTARSSRRPTVQRPELQRRGVDHRQLQRERGQGPGQGAQVGAVPVHDGAAGGPDRVGDARPGLAARGDHLRPHRRRPRRALHDPVLPVVRPDRRRRPGALRRRSSGASSRSSPRPRAWRCRSPASPASSCRSASPSTRYVVLLRAIEGRGAPRPLAARSARARLRRRLAHDPRRRPRVADRRRRAVVPDGRLGARLRLLPRPVDAAATSSSPTSSPARRCCCSAAPKMARPPALRHRRRTEAHAASAERSARHERRRSTHRGRATPSRRSAVDRLYHGETTIDF